MVHFVGADRGSGPSLCGLLGGLDISYLGSGGNGKR